MLNVKHIPSDKATGRLKEFYDAMRTRIAASSSVRATSGLRSSIIAGRQR